MDAIKILIDKMQSNLWNHWRITEEETSQQHCRVQQYDSKLDYRMRRKGSPVKKKWTDQTMQCYNCFVVTRMKSDIRSELTSTHLCHSLVTIIFSFRHVIYPFLLVMSQTKHFSFKVSIHTSAAITTSQADNCQSMFVPKKSDQLTCVYWNLLIHFSS